MKWLVAEKVYGIDGDGGSVSDIEYLATFENYPAARDFYHEMKRTFPLRDIRAPEEVAA